MSAPGMTDEDLLHPFPDSTIRPAGYLSGGLTPPASSVIDPAAQVIPMPAPHPQQPLAANGAPPPAGPVPGAFGNKPILDEKQTTTTTSKLGEEQKKDFADLEKIRGQEQAAAQKLTKDNVADAGHEKTAAGEALVQAQQAQIAKQQAIEDAQKHRIAADAEYQRKLADYNKREFHTFWSGRPVAGEVMADVSQALGAFAASGRGKNEAAEILSNRVAEDFNVQRSNIEKAKDGVVMARTGIEDADRARAIMLEDVDVKNAAALNAIRAKLVAGKMNQGADRAQAEGDMTVAAISKQIQELKEKTTVGMATRTASETKYINPEAVELKAAGRRAGSGASNIIYDPTTGEQLGVAQGSRDLTTIKKNLQTAANAQAALNDLKAFYGDTGNQGRLFDPQKRDLLDTLRKNVVNTQLALNNAGISDTKLKLDIAQLPTAGNITSLNQNWQKQLGALQEHTEVARAGVLRGAGLQPPEGGASKSTPPREEAAPASKAISADDRSYLKAVLASSKSSESDRQKARTLLGIN